MIPEVFFSACFVAACGAVLFPEESKKLKDAIPKATKLTKEQMSASAYTEEGNLMKAYRTQEEARYHRVKLDIGTVIYLPNGTSITAEKGLHDVEAEGWWYAWTTI